MWRASRGEGGLKRTVEWEAPDLPPPPPPRSPPCPALSLYDIRPCSRVVLCEQLMLRGDYADLVDARTFPTGGPIREELLKRGTQTPRIAGLLSGRTRALDVKELADAEVRHACCSPTDSGSRAARSCKGVKPRC